MINSIILFEKEKADDEFWDETGFEEEDVDTGVKNLKAMKDDGFDAEYKKITEEWEAKSKAYLDEKSKQAAAAVAKQQKYA